MCVFVSHSLDALVCVRMHRKRILSFGDLLCSFCYNVSFRMRASVCECFFLFHLFVALVRISFAFIEFSGHLSRSRRCIIENACFQTMCLGLRSFIILL